MLFQAWYVRVPPPAAWPWRRDTNESKRDVAPSPRTIEGRAGTMSRCAVGAPERRLSGSGRRGSNPQLQPWEVCTLPLSYSRGPATEDSACDAGGRAPAGRDGLVMSGLAAGGMMGPGSAFKPA